jgi:hypothetical protein
MERVAIAELKALVGLPVTFFDWSGWTMAKQRRVCRENESAQILTEQVRTNTSIRAKFVFPSPKEGTADACLEAVSTRNDAFRN